MRQYVTFKQQYPDYVLFFRMGDFYELFWDDAKLVARVLNLTLTSRDKNSDAPVPMAGVPYHSAETYLRRLIKAGYRVAIAEQMEDPKLAKGVVKRDVTRLITPGTLTDDGYLDGKTDNYLAAVSFVLGKTAGFGVGLAWVELSTGACFAMTGTERNVLDQLGRLGAAELLLPETPSGHPHPFSQAAQALGIRSVTSRPTWQHTTHHAVESIAKQWGVKTTEGFGFSADDEPALASLGALLGYLNETQKSALGHLRNPKKHTLDAHVGLDSATWRALEIDRTVRSGSTEGSLLASIDRTKTGMGTRLLQHWLRFPLTDLDHIVSRQDAVEALVAAPTERRKIVDALDDVCDVERILSRVALNRVQPRDFAAMAKTLIAIPQLLSSIQHMPHFDAVAPELLQLKNDCLREGDFLAKAISPTPEPHLREGGVIADGFDTELDRLRKLSQDSQAWLAEYQAKLSAASGIGTLKVAYNKVFGYYIEVTDTHREKVPVEWTRRQTVKNAERYVTEELKKFETEVLTARDRSVALEQQLFEQIRQRFLPQLSWLQDLADGVARLDVLAALAELAVDRKYVRPTMTRDRVLQIKEGRHPVLEQQLGAGGTLDSSRQFVANDCSFDAGDHLMLITGPNMAGKSTYIRQVALIALLAHAGSFVPAASATVGLVDRVFARIGASDEIHTGQSTFMVEMTETANILNNATSRSLVVLDEIGRGTSTLDGLSLAWAIAEHLADQTQCRAMFATHYHELTQLAEKFSGVTNFNVAVREWEDQVTFLHKIIPGKADRSYGIHVARLAGVPREVLLRAHELLGQLAVHQVDARHIAPPAPKTGQQLQLFAYEPSALTQALAKLDVDDLSPRQALELLRKWKDEME
jgi:DNA mismatch repair protein MutS